MGRILEFCDASVDFESFRQVLCALWAHLVVKKTVIGARNRQGYLAADAKCACTMHGSSLERLGCCIQADQAGNHECRGDAQTLV